MSGRKGIRLSHLSKLKVLTDDQVDLVHEASLRILGTTGVRFDSEDARARLLKAGATVHPERRGVVTFPRSVVEDAIAHVSTERTFHARDRSWDLEFDGEHMFPYAGGGDPKILDLDTGMPRPSNYADVEMAARLGDALPNNCFASSLVVANDVPHEILVLKTMEATMRNSVKAATGYAPDKESVDFMVRMWACVAGGEEELRKRPLFSLGGSPSSPLTFAKDNCEVLVRSLEHGIPFCVIPCPICGETGPMSLAGGLAQQNAEMLAGLVLMQTVTTRLPVTYAGRLCVMDPRTGRDLWGTPEAALASGAIVQLARRYRMIADVSGPSSDITRWDMQIGSEQMMTGLIPALAGAESISGIGGGWEGASSLELMVTGDELFSDIARIIEGVRVDEDSLATGLIDKVGHMGSFLSEPHTMACLRQGEVRVSPLWDKRGSERAAKEGFRSTQEAARDRVRRILEEHRPEPLDRDVDAAVSRVVKEASRALVGRR